MGLFVASHGLGGVKMLPLPTICHVYPTMMKLGTVIHYLKKIQNIYKIISSADISIFHQKSATLLLRKMQI